MQRIKTVDLCQILAGTVDTIDGNGNIGFGGGSDEPAREYDVTEGSVWADDTWDEGVWTE